MTLPAGTITMDNIRTEYSLSGAGVAHKITVGVIENAA